MKRLVLIDSHALIHRAFHALPMLTSPSGAPTNAVYGFTTVLLKMLRDLKPDYVVATFDLAGPTFRHEQYEEYKAHRERAPDELYAQIPATKQMLSAFGIPVVERAGYEADDIIGTLSLQAGKERDLQTVIVTGDLDTLQLVDKNRTIVFTLRKGMSDTITYDEAAVHERYGISPEQVPDLKGLKGDPSDNIPGVKGIGEKTAAMLIQEFRTLEGVYEALDKPLPPKKAVGKERPVLTDSIRKKLAEHRDMAFFSKQLATIMRDAPVQLDLASAEWREHFDRNRLEELCREFGFYSLAKRLDDVVPVVRAPATLDFDAAPEKATTTTPLIAQSSDLPDGAAAALVATDDTLIVATEAGNAVRAPRELLSAVTEKYSRVICHDIKPILRAAGETAASSVQDIFDTKIAAWLLAPDAREYAFERVLFDVTRQLPDADSAGQARQLFSLRDELTAALQRIGAWDVFTTLEMPLLPILTRMELRGIKVAPAVLAKLLETANTEIAALEKEIYAHAGEEFNINSPQQLGHILFEKLTLHGKVRRTGGGALSTAASELEKLRDEHPVVDLILQYRELNKLRSTYIEPFPQLIGGDGRVHTTYNQTGTATGRLSSQDPNLQNIPTRTELGQKFRGAFVAEDGYMLLSLDYSQLELRLVAHIAHDETMIAAFQRGEDIHTRTAAQVFHTHAAEVTKEMRRQAKVLNFGIIYGMGSVGFARAAGIDRETARRFIDAYLSEFPGVARYMRTTREQAARDGYVATLFGRRRPLPDIASTMPQLAAQAERMAINHPIQGTGADIMKLAMIAVDAHIRSHWPDDSVRLLLQVHDELVLEVRADLVAEVTNSVRSIMEHVHELSVPLTVDAASGPTWADMQQRS